MTKRNPNIGSTLESLYEETGELWEVHLLAQKKLLSLKIQERMRALKMKKSDLAKKISTSRSQIDKCLDPNDIGMTFATMARVTAILDMSWSFSFDEPKKSKRAVA